MQRVNKFLNNNKLSDSLNIEKLLSSCPAHPVGLENLQKNLQAEKKYLSQLLIGLISKVNSKSTCNYENIIKRIKENIDNKQALNEYLQLLSLLSKIEIPETDSTILQYVKKSLGHVNISKNSSFFNNHI